MSTPYYQSKARQAQFAAEAARWIGTPFRARSSVPGPGGGVDCVGLCAAIHVACGACAPVQFERLPLNWHLHHAESGILDFFRAPEIRPLLKHLDGEDEKLTGDLVAIKTAQCVHHLGVWVESATGAHLVHCPLNGSVQRWSLASLALRGRIVGLWRIMEAGQTVLETETMVLRQV